MQGFEIYVKYVFAPIILCLSLFGNTMGVSIMSRRRLNRIGPRNIYRFLFSVECFNVAIVLVYLQSAFKIDLTTMSSIMCKIYWYLCFSYGPIPPMLLVYISVERIVSISYMSKRHILRRPRYQLIYFVTLVLFNLLFSVYVLFNYNIIYQHSNNGTSSMNESKVCYLIDSNNMRIFKYMDLVNRVIIPFLLMLVCTLILVYKIFDSRRKFRKNQRTNGSKKNFNKDILLSVTCVLLNVFYLLLSLPYSLYVLFTKNIFADLTTLFLMEYLVFFGFSLDFYLIFASNSLVRSEFFKLKFTNLKSKLTLT